jgi:hypothetical protein
MNTPIELTMPTHHDCHCQQCTFALDVALRSAQILADRRAVRAAGRQTTCKHLMPKRLFGMMSCPECGYRSHNDGVSWWPGENQGGA